MPNAKKEYQAENKEMRLADEIGYQRYIQAFDPDEDRDEHGRWASKGMTPADSDRMQWPPHIRSLVIPPAWKDVHYNPDPKAALLAVGKDAKGRTQYRYSDAFMNSQSEAKFQRIKELNKKFDQIQKENAADLKSPDPVTKENALVASLVMTTGLRPGSDTDTHADKKAYGATTLEGRHVVVENDKTYLRFTGKKGVSLNIPVEGKGLAKLLQNRAKAAGPTGKLFPQVTNSSLLDYSHHLDGGSFKSKDFRTLLGTRDATEQVKSMPVPKNAKQYKAAVNAVGDHVAKKLGNTRTVALQAYIHPAVFAPWKAAVGV